MSGTQSLPTAVDALEDKARKHKQAQNTQYHVSIARHNISEVNSELDDLEEALRDLRYYKTVLEDAFGGSAPTMLGSAVQTAENVADVTQDDLLGNVKSSEMSDDEISLDEDETEPKVELTSEVETHLSQIRSAKEQVENVSETIQSKLKSKRDT